MTPPEDMARLLAVWPIGTTLGRAFGRPYLATKTLFSAGKSIKLAAQERGGRDYISLNFYDLRRGPQFYPCEMPAQKVIAFVRAYRPDPTEPT